MNRIKLIWDVLRPVGIAVMALGMSATSYAKDDECWADFFEHSQYGGASLHLKGPIQLDNLRSVQGKNWEKRISSLKVGPAAKVTVFENLNFKLTLKEMRKYPELLKSLGLTEEDAKEDAELIFDESSVVHDLSDFNFRNKVRSLKIDCD